MNRKAKVLFHDEYAGELAETDSGYVFSYDSGYIANGKSSPISKTLPVNAKPYTSKVLFPFFDGLIPEGWLLDIAIDNWKINGRDRFGLLLACCKNTIGAVSILALDDEKL
jgi:serine/threonine-protein kinase HipA